MTKAALDDYVFFDWKDSHYKIPRSDLKEVLPDGLNNLPRNLWPHATIVDRDYQFNFNGDPGGEFEPSLTIVSRRFPTPPREYHGEMSDLAKYAAEIMTRDGASRFLLNTLPELAKYAMIKIADAIHDSFHPIYRTVRGII